MIWWPVVQQRLVELLPSLLGDDVLVYDGPPLSDRGANNYVTVGWSESGDSGSFTPTDEPVTAMRAETGVVVCEFVVWGGDETLPAYRTTAFEYVDALEQSLRDDERIGVLPPSSTTSLAADVVSAQDSTGATQRLVVSVNYFVRS